MTERRIRGAEVRHICGDISEMTLWRWLNGAGFPRPIYVGRYRYWREQAVLDWWERQQPAEAEPEVAHEVA